MMMTLTNILQLNELKQNRKNLSTWAAARVLFIVVYSWLWTQQFDRMTSLSNSSSRAHVWVSQSLVFVLSASRVLLVWSLIVLLCGRGIFLFQVFNIFFSEK